MNNLTVAEARDVLIRKVQDDDRDTSCPLCNHRVRNDTKGLNRWMAAALLQMYEYFNDHPNADSVHLGDLVKGTDGGRGHDAALLRHWGLIIPVERPVDADKKLKGSRGLSGFYRITLLGRNFIEGKAVVPKNVIRIFGTDELIEGGPQITFEDAQKATLTTSAKGIIPNGETV